MKLLLPIIFIQFTLLRYCSLTGVGRLFFEIFLKNKYNPMVRPQKNGITHVYTELKILQIDLDEKYQELRSIVWLEMIFLNEKSWQDERLAWNMSEFKNITDLILPVDKVWVPDIVLQNGVGKNEYLYDMKQFMPTVTHEGHVSWVPEIRIFTKCIISIRDFPFDIQRCDITFYSWAHNANQMKILQFENKNVTNTTHFVQNAEWNIFHTCASNKTITTSADLHWWTTNYVLFIKRRNYYHIFNLIIPYCILTLCSTNLFLVPPETGEKIYLGVSLLLAFFLNLVILSHYTPESSNELPIIALYYLFNICLICGFLCGSVSVLNLYFKASETYKVPQWFKKLLCMKSKIDYYSKERHNSSLMSDQVDEKPYVRFNRIRNLERSKSNLDDHKMYLLKQKLIRSNEMFNNGHVSKRSFKEEVSNKSLDKTMHQNDLKILENKAKQLSDTISKLLDKLFENAIAKTETQALLNFDNDCEEDDNYEKNNANENSEWKVLGKRLDQFLFFVSVIFVISSQLAFFWGFYQKDLIPKCLSCLCD